MSSVPQRFLRIIVGSVPILQTAPILPSLSSLPPSSSVSSLPRMDSDPDPQPDPQPDPPSDPQPDESPDIALTPTTPITPRSDAFLFDSSIPSWSGEESPDERPTKRSKHADTGRYYLKLRSGQTYQFEATDGNDILLPEHEEPNPFIRKLVASIPVKVSERMKYLSRFVGSDDLAEADRWNEVVESDPPTEITCLRAQLFTAYLKEIRLRTAFRGLLQRWRIRALDRAEEHTAAVDPITLEPPVHPVTVYDWSHKKKYTFDAHSLSTYLEGKLMYHENSFSMPIFPRNPWTNLLFTYRQLVSIHSQLRHHGAIGWAFVTFRHHQFDEGRWRMYHGSTLTMHAIRASLLSLESVDSREILEDFLVTMMDDLEYTVNDSILSAYRVAMRRSPNHPYLQACKKVAIQYYEGVHFRMERRQTVLEACRRIFPRQWSFFQELFQKKWIDRLPSFL